MNDIVRQPGVHRGRCRHVTYNGMVWAVATALGEGDTVAAQTRVILRLLEESLVEAGSSKHRIIEATIYLTDMSKKDEMDEVWCDWIPDDGWPQRACVGTDLMPGDLLEIRLSAACGDAAS